MKDKKIDLMQRSWALIFPSVKEGWGMTVTECGACGTTSIVADVTGLRDSVIRDKTGLIVSANPRPKEISKAIIKLIENEKLRKKLSKNALVYANTFSWEKSYEGFKNAIRKSME
ncbi:glycosyltransferase [Patescibacteria group bacterium]